MKNIVTLKFELPKIESGIPIPLDARGLNILLLSKMKEGDSFLIKSEKISNIYPSARLLKVKIKTMKIDEVNHRVWLVKKSEIVVKPEVMR